MAASQVLVQQLVNTGLEATYEAANVDGNYFVNNGQTIFYLINAQVVAKTITITSLIPDNYGITHNETITVPASSSTVINFMSKHRFNDANNLVNITYSGVTTLTVAALKVRV
jgi:hypothetical protein